MLPNTEILLFSAARAQVVGERIRPHLDQGGIVLCDRYFDSTLAYQGYGHGLDLATLRGITQFATCGLNPHLTVLLDLPVAIGLQRKAGGQGDAWNRMEQKERSYHERVREGYLALAAESPQRWLVLDATQPVATIQSSIRDRLVGEIVA
jgi:dTMP kinase